MLLCDSRRVPAENTWEAPVADHPVTASVRVPGSKSMTNRAYLLAALSSGETLVRAPLDSRDTRLMLTALTQLGASCDAVSDDVRIHPLTPDDSDVSIELGNAGTVARFLPAPAALSHRRVHFDGDPALRHRPIAPLVSALVRLGVRIDSTDDALPFTIHGQGRLPGGSVELDSSASSQFLSALLLAGPVCDDGITIRSRGKTPSEPHITMTLSMLRQFGAAPEREDNVFHVPRTHLSCPEYTVEPDLSSAAPFVVAPLIAGGTTRILGWPTRTTQPGERLRGLVEELGAEAHHDEEGLVITGTGQLPGAELDLHEVGELTPVVAALLCCADGPSQISGVAHLRGHETDRLAALSTELSTLGAGISQTEDGLTIHPKPMRGGVFHTYDDHRMVMAGAVLGLRVPDVVIDNPTTVGKTYPQFMRDWETMLTTSDR